MAVFSGVAKVTSRHSTMWKSRTLILQEESRRFLLIYAGVCLDKPSSSGRARVKTWRCSLVLQKLPHVTPRCGRAGRGGVLRCCKGGPPSLHPEEPWRFLLIYAGMFRSPERCWRSRTRWCSAVLQNLPCVTPYRRAKEIF